ncbi:hypothetical protein FKV24_003880 [Lysobacter maris]|uniref:Uncharacterized protein n=1 Tax=Marilutibacter maris TaxID=1605891 RepID=A0A508B303_9GAMM|nr:hypothetical protein FKV24_003880 [Lysobacter maris]
MAAVPLAILAACAAPQSGQDGAQPQEQAQAESESPPMVGGDRDAHGCIGSAGYQWCESRNECVRPWELAASEGFEDSAEAFDSHCSAASAGDAPEG